MVDCTKSPPRMNVAIELTDQCNLACPHCISLINHGVQRKNKQNYHDRYTEFLKLSAEIVEYNPRTLLIQGMGEPTIVDYWKDIVSYFQNKRINTYMMSNLAKILSNDEVDVISHLSCLRVSLDAASHKSCKVLRGGLNLDTFVSNMKRINDAALKNQTHPFMVASVVVSSLNIEELVSLFWLLHSLNVKCIDYLPLHTGTSTSTSIKLLDGRRMFQLDQMNCDEKIKIKEIFMILEKLGLENNIRTNIYIPEITSIDKVIDGSSVEPQPTKKNVPVCYAIWDDVFIDCHGNLTPCCHTLHHKEYNLGNVFNESFHSVLNSEKFRTFRKMFLSTKFGLPRCSPYCPQAKCETSLDDFHSNVLKRYE